MIRPVSLTQTATLITASPLCQGKFLTFFDEFTTLLGGFVLV